MVLSPDGEVLKKVSVLDALVASPYARMLNTVAWYSKDDYVHANAIDVVDETSRGAHIGHARAPGAALDA